eukprot:PhF_6_TR32402/c0_g1_i1/m.48073/K00002/AKR1A1, adh; alcohol dehydrogenase (NADP+)
MLATLRTKATMPMIGLGTWQSKPGEVRDAVLAAVRCGYRHIDCASKYDNQREVGEALQILFKEGVVKRSDLFLTSKLWNSFHSRHEVGVELGKTLGELQVDYVDLYLMHWPVNTSKEADGRKPLARSTPQPSLQETWGAMSELPTQYTRAVGVSNFSITKLKDIMSLQDVAPPAVNQVEVHPMLRQTDLIEFCTKNSIHVTAYSPLGSGASTAYFGTTERPSLLQHPTIVSIAAELEQTPAQVVLRWGLQRGTTVIPKSVTPSRIESNLKALQFALSSEQMDQISKIEPQYRMVTGERFTSPEGWYTTAADIWK